MQTHQCNSRPQLSSSKTAENLALKEFQIGSNSRNVRKAHAN